MKSYDDELNDAFKKALQDSLKDFEKEPKASIDQKMYKALLDKPLWRRPLVMLSALVLLLLLVTGFGVIKMTEIHAPFQAKVHLKSTGYNAFAKPVVTTYKKDSLSNFVRKTESNNNFGANQKNIKEQKQLTVALQETRQKRYVTEKESELMKFRKPIDSIEITTLAKPESTESKQLPVSQVAEEFPQEYKSQTFTLLDSKPVSAIAINAALPEIDVADNKALNAITSNIEPAKSIHKKLDIPRYDPAGAKIHSWIFNVAATNTFQSIYLLPSANSRILRVSFPNSTGNLGYKFSAGIQAMGFQVLLNYSHLSWKAEYVYAIDEFKADEYSNKKYVFERLGTAETVTSKLDMAGIGVKKHLDFKSRHLGRIFTQVGLDYSRTIQSNAQNFLSGTISAGKIIKVSTKTDLIIGPYFEYNFKKVPTTEYSIKVRPNQLGLSVGLRFKRM